MTRRSVPLVLQPLLLAALVTAMAAALVACERETPDDGAGTDSGDQRRLVALAPSVAATLVDLGLESQIVGRHGWDMVLDPSLPICGDQAGLDYEQLITINPTHVVLQWGTRELPSRLESLASARGWELINLELLTLDQVRGSIETLGSLAEPERAAALLSRWDAALTPKESMPAEPVLLLGSVDPPAVLGPGSFHHQLLERLGGTPAVTDGGPWIEMDAEDLAAIDPPILMLVLPGSSDPGPELAEVHARLGMRALESGRVPVVRDQLAHLPASSLIRVAEEMARELQRLP